MHVRLSIRFLLAAAAAGCGAHLLAQASAPSVIYPEDVFPELQPLLERALEAAPELEARAEQVEERRGSAIAQASIARSRIDAYGNFAAGYEYRYTPQAGESANIDTIEGRAIADINASVWWRKSLFAWGNNERRLEMAELAIEAGEWDYAEAARTHLGRVREVFMQWSAAREQIDVARENISAAQQFVDGRRRLLEIGETSEQSVLELEARLQQAEEIEAVAAREELYFRRQLELLTGDTALIAQIEATEFPAFDLLTVTEIDALRDHLMAKGFDAPSVEREEAFVEADEKYYEIVARDRRPTLDLTAGLRTDRVDSYQINDYSYRLTSYVGFQVRWNIWDGKRNEGERMAALARRRGREARLEATEAQMAIVAERTFADLILNVRQVATRATRADMLQRRLSLAEDQERAEFIAPFDLLELRLDLLEAERRVLEAKTNYLMNMSRIAALFYVDPVAGL